ncbi:NUDIX domain-containing protein [Catenulispora yoronensis]
MASASLLLTDKTNRTLLVHQTHGSTTLWNLPGGGLEADEYPAQAARRETLEEIGLDINPGTLLMLDWRPRNDARPHWCSTCSTAAP